MVLLDNGRSAMLGTSFEEMLRCIRCGACMNHCPVYHAVGGHAYGWVYPGPMGAVLTPTLIGVDKAGHLPNASTFCGRCESVCPVQDSAAEAHAPLARAGIRAASDARHRALRAWPVGLLRQTPRPLSVRHPPRDGAHGVGRTRQAAASVGCRSLAAGPAIAISRRLRARPFRPGGARDHQGGPDERPRRHSRQHPPLARRERERKRSGGRSCTIGWSAAREA